MSILIILLSDLRKEPMESDVTMHVIVLYNLRKKQLWRSDVTILVIGLSGLRKEPMKGVVTIPPW